MVRGDAQVLRADGSSRAASPGSEFSETDDITTSADSGVSMVLRDGTAIVVGPSAQLRIKRFRFDPVTQVGGLLLRLGRGSMRMATGLIGKHHPEEERVETPTTAIGIRGTDFIVNVDTKP